MATAQMDRVVRHLRRAVLRQDAVGRTDGQLLASFIDQKDEAAFEALVHRHGPMVFGVCRRVVGNHHDAEDAFQATFLVLARKASSVRPRKMVANWLHGVALRTALKAKTMTAKRRGREKQVTDMPEPEAPQQEQDHWHDLQPLLDQELNGLPENYRLPILLCDLEGKTIREATQQLGWPQGTLAGRLSRGRKMLAKRLANRGVVLSAGSLAAVVSQNVASAGIPTSLMSSTVKAATLIAAGQTTVAGVVPAKVAALMEGVMMSMMLTKLSKVAVAGVVVLCLCGLGISGYQALQAQEAKTTPGYQALPAQETKTTTTTTITITTTKSETIEESPFFNGKNLFGWHGLPGYWKVRDGAIIGAPANGIKAHTFLCSEKTYQDFELKFKVKREGGIGNSGVQIRSKIDNRKLFTVRGPQIEIDSANFHYPPGSILTEQVGPPQIKANAATVAAVWQDDGFNDMSIRCEGKWVTVTINGVEVLDAHFPSMPEEGIIAWQLHGGSGGVTGTEEVVFKDIQFKELNVAISGKTATEKQEEDMKKPVTPAEVRKYVKECKKQLQGTWKVMATTGNFDPRAKTVTFSGHEFTMIGDGFKNSGNFEFVNLTGNLKSFDLIFSDGSVPYYSIYQIEGDTLFFAKHNAPQSRPTDFICRPGDGRSGFVARRVEP